MHLNYFYFHFIAFNIILLFYPFWDLSQKFQFPFIRLNMSVQNSFILFDISAHKNRNLRNSQSSSGSPTPFQPQSIQQNQAQDTTVHQQNLLLFIIMNFCTLGFLVEDFMMFLEADQIATMVFIYLVLALSLVSSIINSCRLSTSKSQFLKYFFMLDNICVALIAALVGFIGIGMVFLSIGDTLQLITLILMLFDFLVFTSNYRLTLAKCSWKTSRVVISKLCLLVSCLGYLFLAIYYIKADTALPPLQNASKATKTQQAKQILFLYIFGMLTLYLELFSKITDLDGTGQLKLRYEIIFQEDPEDKSLEQSIKS